VKLRWRPVRSHVNRAAAALLCAICIGCASAAVVRLPVGVIDGDTIRLADEVVRLEGIDAPESRQECRDAAGVSMPADG
jgi:endonuclease YncB( thermonuclease family)